jgi:hypothetical protein
VEAKMLNGSQSFRTRTVQRCPVCHGKFGLVRYYAWWTGFCSQTCRARSKGDGVSILRWLGLLPPAHEELKPVAALIPVRRDGRDGRLVPARWHCD